MDDMHLLETITISMISTVADFLEEFKNYALKKIKEEDCDITHRPTIGNIYEGLTAEILNKGIFKNLDLNLVQNSFIYNDSGKISDEMDCLLVIGSGQKINFTNQYKYHIKDVIAVIQVKKTLYADQIEDSHQNLRSVIDISEPRNAEPFVRDLHRNAYKALTGKEMPTKERLDRFSDRENIIYHYLMMEAFHPLRIVIGYQGFSSEYSLREGFLNKLEDLTKDGLAKSYSPGSFPSLFICGNYSILKNNGMPMGIPLSNDRDFYFHILTTSNSKPMYHLLELIWTRLTYKFKIGSSIFGDDFDLEATHPFLSCKETKIDIDRWGWEYYYHSLTKSELEKPLIPIEWKPAEINEIKFSILKSVLDKGVIDIENDSELITFSKSKNLNIKRVIKELVEDRLIYEDEGKIGLLVDELMISFSPNGQVYAGENKSGEMSNYMKKLIEKSL